ncbi:MAG TPA: fasciclin domain-containing protein [Ilumatobacteraceae bacterium]|nr:fasciclin domain-containing protein [Ilumatobacteraceae bacterium]
MKKSLAGLTAAAIAATLAVPATAGAQAAPGIVDIVVEVSGPSGFDTNGADYDLLREALVATELAGVVASLTDITVFAPTDAAFVRLAQDLGYDGSDEAAAFGFLAGFTGFVSAAEPGLLDDVLLYHVAPGAKTIRELRRSFPIATALEGSNLKVVGNRVIDGDVNDRDARIRNPRDLRAANGIIQTVDRVLRPIDLEPAPAGNIVELVIAASGSEGLDDNGRDYDLLREALVATGLADAVATTPDITVFAPRDDAFIRLARELGYPGHDEAGALATIIDATGFVSAAEPGLLDDILLYHVAPGARTVWELGFGFAPIPTLLEGSSVRVFFGFVVDADRNDRDARIVDPKDLAATNGIIQTVDRVLRPIDLP